MVTINNVSVQLGGRAELNCISSSVNVTSILWSRNGTQLLDDGDKLMIKLDSNNASLTINNINEDDLGVYQCTVLDDLHAPITVSGSVEHTGECVIITPLLCHY